MSEFEEEVISEPSEQIISMPSTSNSSKKGRSQVWEHFEQLETNGKKKGRCTYCRKVLPQ
jgi:hypothetical protein